MTSVAPDDVMGRTILSVALDPTLNYGIEALRARRAEFSSETEMMLTGLAAVPEARQLLDDELETMWAESVLESDQEADEVVIGGGLHAAVYCAARVRMGFPKPLVLERGRAWRSSAACSLAPWCRPSTHRRRRPIVSD